MRHELDRHSPLPLWAQLQQDITQRIQQGEFSREFPGEHDLVSEYAVSRHTVREALRALRESGVLEGGRGRATRVSRPEITQYAGTLYSLFASVQEAGQRARSEVRALEVCADGVVAARLGLEESTPLVRLDRLRLADDEPLAHDCVWLPADVATPLLEADFTATALYTELEQRCGVRLTGGHERVRAVVPTPAERRLLALPEQVAALHLERLGLAHDRRVEWRRTLVRGDRFAFSSDLTTGEGLRVGLAERADDLFS